MANTTHLLYASTRQRGLFVACGHAMSCAPKWVVCDSGIHLLAHIFGMPGVSVPISRGSPPILE
ncbi:MAG: hypothetical protein H0V70_21725 [Ktedonobacteraceae bacterium]|nr:hypothetical protein [Ktedonobacteraceae bacterium]